MKKRNQQVPPPRPPSPPVPSLPAPRPRRLDMPNFGTRTDQERRAVRTPVPPPNWPPVSHDPIDQRPAPARLPEPPENLREALRDLVNNLDRPEPPSDARPWAMAASPEAPKDAGKFLNVLAICTRADRPFVLVFRETRGIFGTHYRLETTLTDIGEGGATSSSLTVPVSSLDWRGVNCPHCRSQCRPIHCGQCQNLACDGRVVVNGDDIYFTCAPSCGARGLVSPALKSVTGSEGRRSPPTAAAGSFFCGPATPSGTLPKLPKPR
jgi:hypothetical protein